MNNTLINANEQTSYKTLDSKSEITLYDWPARIMYNGNEIYTNIVRSLSRNEKDELILKTKRKTVTIPEGMETMVYFTGGEDDDSEYMECDRPEGDYIDAGYWRRDWYSDD